MTEHGRGQLFIRFWRILNSALLAMAFIAPWELVFSDNGPTPPNSLSGGQVVFYSLITSLQYPFGISRDWQIYLSLLFVAGSLCLAGYALLNFTWALVPENYKKSAWQRGLPISIGVGALILFRASYIEWMSVLTWGYWFACLGWFSSVSLEILESGLPRVRGWHLLKR